MTVWVCSKVAGEAEWGEDIGGSLISRIWGSVERSQFMEIGKARWSIATKTGV